MYSLNNRLARGRTTQSHNSLAPQTHAGHQFGYTLLWDGLPFFKQHLLQVIQRGCVGHSGMNGEQKLITWVFSGVEVRTGGRPFLHLNSQILEVVSYKPHSVGAIVEGILGRVQSQRYLLCTLTLQSNCCRKNPDWSLNIKFTHMFRC